MKTESNNNLKHKRQGKGKKFNNEMQIVFESFYEDPKTMRQVEVETGIRRDHITRYVAILRKQNKITLIKKGICPITRMNGVQFLSTNPDHQPDIIQQSLFDKCKDTNQ